MKTINTLASAQKVNFPLPVEETQIAQRSSEPAKFAYQSLIGVEVGSSTRSVLIEIRPVAVDKALKTQRLNRALEVGYFTPTQDTTL